MMASMTTTRASRAAVGIACMLLLATLAGRLLRLAAPRPVDTVALYEPSTARLLVKDLHVSGPEDRTLRLGGKAALVPLHGWLPKAMVAPAPVSALLHAVAVVKAGAFAIQRVVYEVFGIEFAATLGVLTPLAAAASLTIVYGSLRALTQDELKKRDALY